jgi:tetratricopeptide (TPR) repeat protein
MSRAIPILLLLVASGAAAQDRLQAGMSALTQGNLAEAQANLEAAAKQNPNDPRAWVLLAQTYARQKNQASALEAARKAETLGAENPEILQALANVYSGLIPDAGKAASLGARYAERRPEDKTAWRRLAQFCLATRQPDRAIEAAKRGLPVDNSAALHGILGQAYAERQQWADAAAELSTAVKMNPYDEELHFRLSQVYLMQQQWPQAATALENARAYFDKSPQIELALGVAYYGEREFPKAVDQFLRTIRLAPDVQQPYVFLGRILEHTENRLPEVTARFADYQAANPKSPLGYVLHAKAILSQLASANSAPDTKTAADLLQKALSLKEDDAEAHYLLGVALDRQSEFPKAAAELERSIALNPNDAAAHYRLARVYARLGRKEDAERERVIHEKLSNDANAPDSRGTVAAPPRPAK